MRAGFRVLLDAEPGIEVVGEADDGHEAVELTRAPGPTWCSWTSDARPDGIDATRMIAADPALDAVRVLILTTFELDEYVVRRRCAPAPAASSSRTPSRSS